MSKSRSVGGSLREGWRDSDTGKLLDCERLVDWQFQISNLKLQIADLDTGVQLEEKRERSSRKFSREGLILGRWSGASYGAAEISGETKIFLRRDQNGLVWS